MSEFDINAFFSPLTRYSLEPVSTQGENGTRCYNELPCYGRGFACVAVASGLLGVRFYKPCRMKKGQCPINQYKESPLPLSIS